MKSKHSIRIDDSLYDKLEIIAKAENQAVTQAFETAIKVYLDYYYMQNDASIINQEIINITKRVLNVAERNINNKTASVVGELATQAAISNMILAKSLEISNDDLNVYRIKAIAFLKERQRVLRLDEVTEDA